MAKRELNTNGVRLLFIQRINTMYKLSDTIAPLVYKTFFFRFRAKFQVCSYVKTCSIKKPKTTGINIMNNIRLLKV